MVGECHVSNDADVTQGTIGKAGRVSLRFRDAGFRFLTMILSYHPIYFQANRPLEDVYHAQRTGYG